MEKDTDNIDESLEIDVQDESNSQELRRSNRIKGKPQISYEELDFHNDYIMLSAQSVDWDFPHSYYEIKNRRDREKWEKAINEELDALRCNNTWQLVPKPENKNIVDCKLVFTIKDDEFVNPLKYKARLVARGFSQEYLVDYHETFELVARISSFRFIIAFANQNNLLVHHMDVKTAFLIGNLKVEIYEKIRKKYALFWLKKHRFLYRGAHSQN